MAHVNYVVNYVKGIYKKNVQLDKLDGIRQVTGRQARKRYMMTSDIRVYIYIDVYCINWP